ncbi:MAG: hypothetical protein QW478_01830 [Candidatus Micrarchaeaceae archaeon]
MRYWFIIFLDKLSDIVSIKSEYTSQENAAKALEKYVIDYIKDMNGIKQLEKCNRTNVQDNVILNEVDFNGLFYRKVDDKIELYEKKTVVVPGTLWNSLENKIIKLGIFMIVNYHIEDYKLCSCNVARTTCHEKKEIPFMNELIERLKDNKDGNFGLKHLNSDQEVDLP